MCRLHNYISKGVTSRKGGQAAVIHHAPRCPENIPELPIAAGAQPPTVNSPSVRVRRKPVPDALCAVTETTGLISWRGRKQRSIYAQGASVRTEWASELISILRYGQRRNLDSSLNILEVAEALQMVRRTHDIELSFL